VPRVRTTFTPWEITEVDASELANLSAMGVVAEVLADDVPAAPPVVQSSRAAVSMPAEG
jgi:hypothetical protein